MLDKKSQVINYTHQLLHQKATIILTYVDGEFKFAVRIYDLHNIIIKDVLCAYCCCYY